MFHEQFNNPSTRDAASAHGMNLANIRELSVNPKDPASLVLLHYGFKAFAQAVLAHEALKIIEAGRQDTSRLETRFKLKEPLSFLLYGVEECGFVVPKAALKISEHVAPRGKAAPSRVEFCAASLLKPLLNPAAAQALGSITPAAATLPPNFLKLTWSKNDLLDRAKMGAAFRAAELLFTRSLARFKQHEEGDSFSNGALSATAEYLAAQMEQLSKGTDRQVSLGMGSTLLLSLREGLSSVRLPPLRIPEVEKASSSEELPPQPPREPSPEKSVSSPMSRADAFAALVQRIGGGDASHSRKSRRQNTGKPAMHRMGALKQTQLLDELKDLGVRLCHPDMAKRVDARSELASWDGPSSPQIDKQLARLDQIAARVDREEAALQLVRMMIEDGELADAHTKLQALLVQPVESEENDSAQPSSQGLKYLGPDAERLAKLLNEISTATNVSEAPTMVWPSANGSISLCSALQMAFLRGAEAEVFTDKGYRFFGRLGCYMSQEPELADKLPEFLLLFSESTSYSNLIYEVDFGRYYIGADELKNLDKITEGLLAGLERYGDPKRSDEQMRHEAERCTFRVPLAAVTKINFFIYKGPTPQEVRLEKDRQAAAKAYLKAKAKAQAEEKAKVADPQ